MLTDWQLLVLVMVVALATYLWRGLGVLFSGRIRADSPVFEWVGYVAGAMIAGLTARMILFPAGELASTLLASRIAACALALVVYFALRRNLLWAVTAGIATLATLNALTG